MKDWPDTFNVVFTNPILPDMVQWSRRHFDSIKEGGAWAVPRSGMIFIKRGNSLVLTVRMPHDPNMPVTAEQLDRQQQREYADVKRHFEAAGITVLWDAP